MKKPILIIIACFSGLGIFAQPFPIGHTTITLTDTSRNNRAILTEIYYPADVAGTNVPLTAINSDKFPILSFGHGFVMTWDVYQNIWDALVPEGFIIAFPTTEGTLSPSHLEFAKDISYVITALTILGHDSSSLFYDRVDTMNCVMGHSMGGGSSFLAAQLSANIKTLLTLAPAETNPSAIQSAASLFIPALILAGGNDCVTPPPAHQIPMYDSLQSICKTFISINGGSHCQMADNNTLCNFGELTCTPQPAITRGEQHIVINRYLIPWLKYELKGDCLAGLQFDSLITTDSTIVFQNTCIHCIPSSINQPPGSFSMDIFPNPFHDQIYIRYDKSVNTNVSVDLCYLDGRKLFSQTFPTVKPNEILKFYLPFNFPSGIYLLDIKTNGERIIKKIIKDY